MWLNTEAPWPWGFQFEGPGPPAQKLLERLQPPCQFFVLLYATFSSLKLVNVPRRLCEDGALVIPLAGEFSMQKYYYI